MILKEVFERVHWTEVAIAIVSSYPNQRKSIHEYEDVFNLLKQRSPIASEMRLVIEYIEDDLEPGYYYHLSGKKEGDDQNRSLMFCPWSKWLGMKVSEATLSALSYPQIVAHILFEITFAGFT